VPITGTRTGLWPPALGEGHALSQGNRLEHREVERRSWYLWFAAFSIILTFAATVHILHLRLLATLSETGEAGVWLRNGYFTGIGLTGLVFLFILYTALKQLQLHRMHLTLTEEEAELEDLRARLSELTTLFQLATALNLQLSVDTILGIIVRRVVAALKAQQASIMLYNPKTELLETRTGSAGWEKASPDGWPSARKRSCSTTTTRTPR
jgi:nitrate/nitrite-specific signal transduction histidine kinase